jgi:hypothetical protein
VDRLDRLTQRLTDEMDQQTDRASRDCLGPALLERFATGGVDPPTRERVEAHLDQCLTCANRYVELRDDLQAMAAPEPVSPVLRQTLERLIGGERRERFPTRVAGSLRRALVFRVPAWAVAAVAAGIMVITWTVVSNLQRPGAPVEWPVEFSSPGQLTPAHRQLPRTVSGVVSSLRDATSSGVEAHVISLKDTSGATYVLFAWGGPTVKLGDSVEIDGIFTSAATQSAGLPVYQGVAIQLRRTR